MAATLPAPPGLGMEVVWPPVVGCRARAIKVAGAIITDSPAPPVVSKADECYAARPQIEFAPTGFVLRPLVYGGGF